MPSGKVASAIDGPRQGKGADGQPIRLAPKVLIHLTPESVRQNGAPPLHGGNGPAPRSSPRSPHRPVSGGVAVPRKQVGRWFPGKGLQGADRLAAPTEAAGLPSSDRRGKRTGRRRGSAPESQHVPIISPEVRQVSSTGASSAWSSASRPSPRPASSRRTTIW